MKSPNHDTPLRSKSHRAVVVDHKSNSNSNDTNDVKDDIHLASSATFPTAVPATTTSSSGSSEGSWITTTTTTTTSSSTAAGWLPAPSTVPPGAPPFSVTNSNNSNNNCGNQPPHAAASAVVLEVAVVLVWLVAVLCAAYYIQTEHQHRRRRLRRQRQERLEEFSPRQQAHRKVFLQQLFHVQSTTLQVVQSTDFRRVHNTNNHTNHTQDLSLDWKIRENPDDHGQNNQHNNDHCTKKDNRDGNGEMLTVNDGDEETRTGESQQLCHGKEFGQKAVILVSSSSHHERTTLDHGVREGSNEERANHGNHPNEEKNHDDDDNDDSNDNDNDESEEEQWTLQLPTGRWIPATCIICLKRYQPGDWVAWSPNYDRQDDDGRTNGHTNHNSHHTNTNCNNNAAGCPHAFHQQCVIEWLAKLPNCNCPVCRKPFCHLSSLQQHNKTITKDIANNNDTDTAKQDQDQDKQERKGGEILSKPLLHFTV